MPAEFPPKSLDALLQPIAPDAPAGASLRYEGTYDKVRAARRADDASLPQGEWKTTLKRADFDAVAALSEDALAHRSKDLQLAVWLVEAWIELHGVAGVAPGLRLVAGLCDRFWDTMFPALADGVDARVALLDWMDDTGALALRLVPLSDAASGAPYSLSDWEGAQSRIGRPTPADDPARPTWEAILAQTTLTGRDHWAALRADVGDAVRAAGELAQALGGKAPDAPAVRRMTEVLRAVAGIADQATHALGGPEPDSALAHVPEGAAADATVAFSPSSSSIRSRAEAYLRLNEAANFLLRTEPHSPVPYLVMRAVAWGNMSLAELLHEFVDRADDLVAIQVLLGMRRKE